ncbi:hydrogenase maturation protease [Ostreiculturibacter nitratireducens]|uniref:hydrogenase maturation protease n=1 Tax=Ostreiculturibacter nitratireducens TaxID=3075226 RepID=UPI0031B61FB7
MATAGGSGGDISGQKKGQVTRLVIGCGNPMRHDDGAGRAVARALSHMGMEAVEASGEAGGLLALFEGRRDVVLVDACASGSEAGTVHEFEAGTGPLPASLGTVSSHGFGAAAAIELARSLGALPPRLRVFAIEGTEFGHGEGLSPPVEAAVAALVRRLAREA